MKQNDWLVLTAVILLLYWLSRKKLTEEVTSTFSFPGLDTSTRDSGGDLLSHIIAAQHDQIQNY